MQGFRKGNMYCLNDYMQDLDLVTAEPPCINYVAELPSRVQEDLTQNILHDSD